MIRVLFDGMFNLLTNLMKKFIKKKHIFEKLRSNEDLFNVDVSKTSNHKPLNLIEIGTKAKLLLSGCVLLEDEKEKKFRSECLQFYIEATDYLKNSLPFDCRVIRYAQYLHREKRTTPDATSGDSSLALKITKVIINCTKLHDPDWL